MVRAFNENLLDDFTRWQLAVTFARHDDQKIASGFNRCNVTTGGRQYRHEWIYCNADRIDGGGVWMGSPGCWFAMTTSTTHFTKEYYSMYAFFSAADPALDGNKLNTPPVLQFLVRATKKGWRCWRRK